MEPIKCGNLETMYEELDKSVQACQKYRALIDIATHFRREGVFYGDPLKLAIRAHLVFLGFEKKELAFKSSPFYEDSVSLVNEAKAKVASLNGYKREVFQFYCELGGYEYKETEEAEKRYREFLSYYCPVDIRHGEAFPEAETLPDSFEPFPADDEGRIYWYKENMPVLVSLARRVHEVIERRSLEIKEEIHSYRNLIAEFQKMGSLVLEKKQTTLLSKVLSCFSCCMRRNKKKEKMEASLAKIKGVYNALNSLFSKQLSILNKCENEHETRQNAHAYVFREGDSG